jgi:hypothetical protein
MTIKKSSLEIKPPSNFIKHCQRFASKPFQTGIVICTYIRWFPLGSGLHNKVQFVFVILIFVYVHLMNKLDVIWLRRENKKKNYKK